jgi:hypothetical protein
VTHEPSTLIDLARYPLDRLDSEAGQALIESCRTQLAQTGCCNLSDFIRPDALKRMVAEAQGLDPVAYRQDGRRNAYFTKDDPQLSPDDPRRRFWHYRMHQVAGDVIPAEHGMRILFEWDGLTEFFRRILDFEALYRMADPFQNLNVISLHDGHHQPWHYDQGEFAVTLLLQASTGGGYFEFVPQARTETDENLDRIAAIMDGTDPGILRPTRDAGTLTIFRGMYALHRVTQVSGPKPRITAVLSYDTTPDRFSTDAENSHIYGPRVAGILADRKRGKQSL